MSAKIELSQKQVVSDLVEALEDKGFICEVGDGYLNISRRDGIHCEFYPCWEGHAPQFEMYAATYTIDGKETDLDFEMPFDQDEMIEAVEKILSFDAVKKQKLSK